MRTLRSSIASAAGATAPRGEIVRLRFQMTLDMLLTLAVAVLAVALVVAFQVVIRIGSLRGNEQP